MPEPVRLGLVSTLDLVQHLRDDHGLNPVQATEGEVDRVQAQWKHLENNRPLARAMANESRQIAQHTTDHFRAALGRTILPLDHYHGSEPK